MATEGEVGTLVFGGTDLPRGAQGPVLALGGGLVGGTYTERLVPEELTPGPPGAWWRRHRRPSARVVADRFGVADPLLYARIDMVTLDDGSDVVLEVELAEPTFFLRVAPEAAARFAALVARPRRGDLSPARPGPRGRGRTAGRDLPRG